MTLPELAIKRHVTTLMIIVSLVVLGLVALFRLPLAFLPDFEQPHIFVRLPYESASPEQIERMIVRPVEDALGSVKGLRQMWAHCDRDGGMVRLQFDWSTDMSLARVEVWEKIDRIRRDLPDDVGDITVSSNWDSRDADMPILEGRISSKRDLSESYDLLERKIIKPIERVARGRAGAARRRQSARGSVNLRIADIEAHRVDIRGLRQTLANSNFDMSLGKITEGESRFAVRTVGAFQ